MRIIGWLLVFCVAMAVLKAALALLLVGALVVGLLTNPRGTISFIILLMALSLVDQHPAHAASAFGILVIFGLAGKAIE